MTDIESYVWDMGKLWSSRFVSGDTTITLDNWVLIETAKLAESGDISDKTGREVTNTVMQNKRFMQGLQQYINASAKIAMDIAR